MCQLASGDGEMPRSSADDALRRLYGYPAFRRLQRPIVQAMLDGRDVLAVLPTGAGKSLCFQLPALIGPGVTVVTSPLISLMQDQVAALRRKGHPAAAVTSATSASDRRRSLAALSAGHLRLLYVSPEMLWSPHFRRAWGGRRPDRLVVDEAHCISEWGHDFRPSYRRVGDFAREAGRPPIAAFTATATPRTRADIELSLGLSDPFRVVAPVDRRNIHWAVCRARSLGEGVSLVGEAVRRVLRSPPPGAVIVYVPTRAGTARVARSLCRLGVRAEYYHAGLEGPARRAVQERFLAGELRVVCATNAFGMGIDHPHVRLVCHCGMPGALEAYVQEAGRGGRDGNPAHALLILTPGDRKLQESLIRDRPGKDRMARDRSRARLAAMMRYVSGRGCRRAYIARYFGERPRRCAGCDRCGPAGNREGPVARLGSDPIQTGNAARGVEHGGDR
jgi:ATP-dependent DNA helicase RecQ